MAMPVPDAPVTERATRESGAIYVIVWIALMVLALISYLFSLAHLGALDEVLALLIALVKTVLVALFFMELIHHRFVNTLILIVSGGFVVLLVSLMVADIRTRHTFPPAPLPVLDETARK
jgi:cytochrome c oxidase subunit 4